MTTTFALLVSSSSSAATAVFKIGGGKNNNSNARRPRNQHTERSRHLSPTQRKTSTRAASLPPSRFNFTSSNQNNNSESSSSSSSYPNGNSHRLSAMEEEGFAGKSAFFEEALSEQERTRSRMFNTEPLSMVTPTARQESNGSASTSSFTSSSNSNSSNEIGTFFKHEPREKWKKKNKFPVLFY